MQLDPTLPISVPTLMPMELKDFINMELPPRGMMLSPWLPEKGLAMVYAYRGIGKTFFALSAAYAVSVGASFLAFSAPTPQRVLYVDGEMPAQSMKERLNQIINGSSENSPPDEGYFRILCADTHENGLPDLGTTEGQAAFDLIVGDTKLIVIDNLSTLVRSAKENEADSWGPIQNWLLSQRRAGRSVLLVHHAGKNGGARGTSKREDIMDTVISLKRPEDYDPEEGARFEIHFEKARGLYGLDARSVEARYEIRNSAAHWQSKYSNPSNLHQAADLCNAGMSGKDAAEQLGISAASFSRIKQKAKQAGLLVNDQIEAEIS